MSVPVKFRQDDAWHDGAVTHVRIDGQWVPVSGLARRGSTPDDPTPPVSARRLGIYQGTPAELPDETTLAQFGHYPRIASTYYISTQQTLNMTYETARINRGTSPLITLTTKDTNYMTELANSSVRDAWLQTYVDRLHTLSLVNPNVPVYATLDHEWEVKVNQGILTGSNADPTNYAKALKKLFTMCDASAPNVQYGYWYGHFDTAAIAEVLVEMAKVDAAPKYIALDPYQNGQGGSTAAANWAPKLSWLKARPQYTALGSPPIGIAEFGMGKGNNGYAVHTDAQLATFYGYLHAQMEASDVIFALLFHRDKASEPGYIITDGAHPLAVAAFASSLGGA